jgi:hypothetical protein
MEPTIVNAKPRYRPATLVEPPGLGYLLVSGSLVSAHNGPMPKIRITTHTQVLGCTMRLASGPRTYLARCAGAMGHNAN